MEITIRETRLEPEEERRRLKRFFDIILEADLKVFKQMSEAKKNKIPKKRS